MSLVISGFPGIGKSYLPRIEHGAIDLDSSRFSWVYNQFREPVLRDPEWPLNYIAHIKGLTMRPEVTYILVSSHKEVRDGLVQARIPFLLVYPAPELKAEYIQRYTDRKSSPDFLKLLDTQYDAWIAELQAQTDCEHRVLQSGQYLADVLQ